LKNKLKRLLKLISKKEGSKSSLGKAVFLSTTREREKKKQLRTTFKKEESTFLEVPAIALVEALTVKLTVITITSLEGGTSRKLRMMFRTEDSTYLEA